MTAPVMTHTTDDLPLFSWLPDAQGLVEARFTDFDRRNPHVYRRLVELARNAVQRGHRRISIAMLFEVIRYEYHVTTDAKDHGELFVLNNNYKPWYARKIMEREPELAGIFELREIRVE